jgi:adenosylcobinamide-GDP ribazoletransferase
MTQPQASDADQEHPPGQGERSGEPEAPRPNGFLLALQFLTVVPVQLGRATTSQSGAADTDVDMGRALPWFPLIGALLGAGVVVINRALALFLGRGVRDVVVVAVLLLATGMLHFDGFVDCCDALLGARSVERRLEILRDSRVGAYGLGGGAVLLIARYATLESLSAGLWALAVVAAVLIGRWAMVWLITLFPYARTRGAGSSFQSDSVRLAVTSGIAIALLGALAAFASGGAFGRNALVLALLGAAGLAVALLWALWSSRRLGGGLTGDAYGAANELVEVTILALAPVVMRLVSSII